MFDRNIPVGGIDQYGIPTNTVMLFQLPTPPTFLTVAENLGRFGNQKRAHVENLNKMRHFHIFVIACFGSSQSGYENSSNF